jgi:diguanylate cyclase (GGDEF)-like protein
MKAGADSVALFSRLCVSITESRIPTRSGVLSITASIGVASAAPGSNADQMLEAADAALYRAKDAGRNRVAYDGRCSSPPGSDPALPL